MKIRTREFSSPEELDLRGFPNRTSANSQFAATTMSDPLRLHRLPTTVEIPALTGCAAPPSTGNPLGSSRIEGRRDAEVEACTKNSVGSGIGVTVPGSNAE